MSFAQVCLKRQDACDSMGYRRDHCTMLLPGAPTTRSAYDELLATLVGRSIVGVTYIEIDYGDGEPHWGLESPDYDSLDQGLLLRLEGGSALTIVWGTEFTQYGLSLVPYEFEGYLGVNE